MQIYLSIKKVSFNVNFYLYWREMKNTSVRNKITESEISNKECQKKKSFTVNPR